MNYIDTKYLNLLSPKLQQFKRKSSRVWNFRCPYCGDSKSNKLKARGYVFPSKATYVYKCHNCGMATSLQKLIQHVDLTLYDQYVAESYFKPKQEKEMIDISKPDKLMFKRIEITPMAGLQKIEDLDTVHYVKQYIFTRKIPMKYWSRLFFAPDFFKFANECVPGKFDDDLKAEPRLIIPFLDNDNNLIGFQGRALMPTSNAKYITIMMDEGFPKVFGLDEIDWSKPITVVEGPIDSMFLNNCLAMAGADLPDFEVEANYVFCYDNEPRNKEIVRRMEDAIKSGHSVVIFPKNIDEKDINDMIMAGRDPARIIKENTYKGLMAEIKLSEWRK